MVGGLAVTDTTELVEPTITLTLDYVHCTTQIMYTVQRLQYRYRSTELVEPTITLFFNYVHCTTLTVQVQINRTSEAYNIIRLSTMYNAYSKGADQ